MNWGFVAASALVAFVAVAAGLLAVKVRDWFMSSLSLVFVLLCVGWLGLSTIAATYGLDPTKTLTIWTSVAIGATLGVVIFVALWVTVKALRKRRKKEKGDV